MAHKKLSSTYVKTVKSEAIYYLGKTRTVNAKHGVTLRKYILYMKLIWKQDSKICKSERDGEVKCTYNLLICEEI